MSSSRAIAGARQKRAGEPVSAANYVQQQTQQQPQSQKQYDRQQNATNQEKNTGVQP